MSSFKKSSSAYSAASTDTPSDKLKDTPTTDEPTPQPKKARAKEMAKYGITRVPVDYFHYGDFRYTSLKDAVAQAKRTVQRESPLSIFAEDIGAAKAASQEAV